MLIHGQHIVPHLPSSPFFFSKITSLSLGQTSPQICLQAGRFCAWGASLHVPKRKSGACCVASKGGNGWLMKIQAIWIWRCFKFNPFLSTGEKSHHKSSCHKFDNSLEEIHGMWHVHLFTTIWQHLWVENSQIASLFFLSKLLPRAEVPGVLSEAPGTENPGKMFFNPHIISKVPCSLRLHLPVQGLPALARNQSCLHETPQWEVQHWVLLGLTPAKWQFLRHVFLLFCPAILCVETGQVQNTLIAKSRHNDSAGVKGGLSQVVVRAPSNVCTAITGQKAANKWKCEKLDLEHPTNTWQCPEICY